MWVFMPARANWIGYTSVRRGSRTVAPRPWACVVGGVVRVEEQAGEPYVSSAMKPGVLEDLVLLESGPDLLGDREVHPVEDGNTVAARELVVDVAHPRDDAQQRSCPGLRPLDGSRHRACAASPGCPAHAARSAGRAARCRAARRSTTTRRCRGRRGTRRRARSSPTTCGRRTGTPSWSACSWHSRSLALAPPSTRRARPSLRRHRVDHVAHLERDGLQRGPRRGARGSCRG